MNVLKSHCLVWKLYCTINNPPNWKKQKEIGYLDENLRRKERWLIWRKIWNESEEVEDGEEKKDKGKKEGKLGVKRKNKDRKNGKNVRRIRKRIKKY